MVTPADMWNHLLPDPISGAGRPRAAGDLLAAALLHAAHARAEAAGAKAAVAELAKQLTAELDDEALIARMQHAVREAMAEIVRGRSAPGPAKS